MAWELVDETPKKTKEKLPDFLAQQPMEESWPKTIGRNVGAGLLGGLENLIGLGKSLTTQNPFSMGGLMNLAQTVSGAQQPTLSDVLQKTGSVSQEFFEPQNPVEDFIQTALSQAPLQAILAMGTGGMSALAPAAKQLGIGAGTSAALGSMGAPDWLKGIGQILAEGTYGFSKSGAGRSLYKKTAGEKRIGTLGGRPKTETIYKNPLKEAQYAKTRELAKKHSFVSSKPIEEALDKVESSFDKIIDPKAKKSVESIYNTMKNNVAYGMSDLSDLMDINTNINAAYEKAPQEAQHIYTKIRKSLDEVFSKADPLFYESWSEAKRLHTLENSRVTMEKVADFVREKSGRWGKWLPQFEMVLAGPERYMRNALPNKIAREIFGKALLAAAKNEIPTVANNIKKLGKIWDSKQPEMEFTTPKKDNWVLVD